MSITKDQPHGTEESLLRDIAYGLRNVPELQPKRNRGAHIDPREMAARAVLDHLKLANWRFEMGPPTTPHSIYIGPSSRTVIDTDPDSPET